ncbi:MAG: hypothetical protein IT440_10080 [Phycisphaeraceae bacterium]|nr:hypothetical protein [Phycisphaeraceae bacterium]
MKGSVLAMMAVAAAAVAGTALTLQGSSTPAEFEVTPEVVAADPGPYAATLGRGMANTWLNGGAFEPLTFRRMFHVQGDSPDEMIVGKSSIDGYNVWRGGLWTGARARVYRIRDGKFALVRTDTVARHDASGWTAAPGFSPTLLSSPSATTTQIRLPSFWRRGVSNWFCVVAVDAQGRQSQPSNVLELPVPPVPEKDADPVQSKVALKLRRPADEDGAAARDIASPAHVQAKVDANTGIITFTWDASPGPKLAGYLVLVSDDAPAQQRGFHLVLSQRPTDPAQQLKTGDLVFLDKEYRRWDPDQRCANRIHNIREYSWPELIPFGNDANRTWSLVEHPGPLPAEFKDHGQTCLQLDLRDDQPVVLGQYVFSSTEQNWYRVLDPDKTYVVEFRARSQGVTKPATFRLTEPYTSEEMPPLTFELTGEWVRHRGTFRVPRRLTAGTQVGQMQLQFQGPGVVWVDNVRVYEDSAECAAFVPEDVAVLRESKLSFLRTHSLIKSPMGYSLDALTNARGMEIGSGLHVQSQYTLDSLLHSFEQGGVNPWLQIEMCLDDEEWRGLVEYLAAPYDPRTDTPRGKPWAYKRYQQGRTQPWSLAFDRILFEISNETWNFLFRPWIFNGMAMTDEATGRVYRNGEIYGLFQEHVIAAMKSSPYWTADLDKRMSFVLGGWAIRTTADGYGQQSAMTSPHSRYMTVAEYNGGWDEKESPAQVTDEFFFQALSQTAQVAIPRADAQRRWLAEHRRQFGGDLELGTYEAGPGYNLNGLNGVKMTPDQTEAESKVLKSLAGGTATLDNFLARSHRGYTLQNFFTFARNRLYWTSHARMENGGQAYPSWMALSLYNRQGTGDFLGIRTISVLTADLPRTARRDAMPDAPMVAAYATRQGDRVNLFLLSRKLNGYPSRLDDGFVPVKVTLPFTQAQRITLHAMTGDPRANNLDAANVTIQTRDIPAAAFHGELIVNDATGVDARGLPPASVLLYVLEGVK